MQGIPSDALVSPQGLDPQFLPLVAVDGIPVVDAEKAVKHIGDGDQSPRMLRLP